LVAADAPVTPRPAIARPATNATTTSRATPDLTDPAYFSVLVIVARLIILPLVAEAPTILNNIDASTRLSRLPGFEQVNSGQSRLDTLSWWTIVGRSGNAARNGAVADRQERIMRELFSFPNPVNEVSARLVAGGVVILTIATIVFAQPVLLVLLAYGFVARVLTGPTLSPLGQFVTRVLTPKLGFEAKNVPGPPKRFAQGIGATLSVAAVVCYFGFGFETAAFVLVGLITIAATLESVFALCLGCKIFAVLMRIGIISEEVCESCNDIWRNQAPVERAAS
jgi:hypothetical protein